MCASDISISSLSPLYKFFIAYAYQVSASVRVEVFAFYEVVTEKDCISDYTCSGTTKGNTRTRTRAERGTSGHEKQNPAALPNTTGFCNHMSSSARDGQCLKGIVQKALKGNTKN